MARKKTTDTPVETPVETTGVESEPTNNVRPKKPRDVTYLVVGDNVEGVTVIMCSFGTLHQLKKYYNPLASAFRGSYRNIRFMKAKPITGV